MKLAPQQEHLREETVAWLNSLADWEVFFTGTTAYVASMNSLRKSFERFMYHEYNYVSYIYSLEPHASCGFHVHAMFAESYGLRWRDFWRNWHTRYGRNRTEPIKHKADVNKYVSKYVIKEWGFKGDDRSQANTGREIWWNVKLKHRQFVNK
jgi:hypothetical protein